MRTQTIAAARSLKKFTLMAIAAMGTLVACAYGENSIAHMTSGVVPGKWTSDFAAAKAYADANHVPLFSYWGSESCGWCSRMKRMGINTSEFEAWVAARPIVLLCTDTNQPTVETEVKTFTKGDNHSGIFPYLRIYWPKEDGTLVSVCFTGRSGKMPYRSSNTLVGQLIGSLNMYVGSWSPVTTVEYTVSFNGNGGTVSAAKRMVEEGKAVGALPTATRAGYNFSGWFTAATGGTQVTAATKVTGNVTYYAQWSLPTVTVTFNANGGVVSPATRAVTKGAALGALPKVAREGYTLVGWYTAATGGTPVTADTKVAAAATYYAQWAAGTWSYTADAAGVTINGVYPATGAITVPAVLGGQSVTAVGQYAFFKNATMTSVSFPASVKTIGYKAFKGCSALTSAVLPAGLTKIGAAAFQECTALTAISVPGSVAAVPNSAFEGCTALKTVTLAAGTTTIGTSAFAKCPAIASISLPAGMTSVGNYAFFGCSALASATIPSGVTTIGEKAFKNCTSLPSVTLPATLANLGAAAFFNTGLTTATVPGSVAEVKDYTFQKCAALKSVTLSYGVQSIGKSVFANDDVLAKVTLSGTLEEIGAYAFFRCPALGSQVLPETVTTIGEKAYKHCSSMTALTLPAGMASLPREVCNYCSTLKTVNGGALTSVSLGAFGNCPALTSVAGLNADALALVKRGYAWSK